MPSGVSCGGAGGRAVPSGCQLFLSSVLPAPIIILTNEHTANCFLQACACHQLSQEDLRARPALCLLYLCGWAPAAVLGTQSVLHKCMAGEEQKYMQDLVGEKHGLLP